MIISSRVQAFLIPEYQQENPDDAHHVNRLKELIVEQVRTSSVVEIKSTKLFPWSPNVVKHILVLDITSSKRSILMNLYGLTS